MSTDNQLTDARNLHRFATTGFLILFFFAIAPRAETKFDNAIAELENVETYDPGQNEGRSNQFERRVKDRLGADARKTALSVKEQLKQELEKNFERVVKGEDTSDERLWNQICPVIESGDHAIASRKWRRSNYEYVIESHLSSLMSLDLKLPIVRPTNFSDYTKDWLTVVEHSMSRRSFAYFYPDIDAVMNLDGIWKLSDRDYETSTDVEALNDLKSEMLEEIDLAVANQVNDSEFEVGTAILPLTFVSRRDETLKQTISLPGYIFVNVRGSELPDDLAEFPSIENRGFANAREFVSAEKASARTDVLSVFGLNVDGSQLPIFAPLVVFAVLLRQWVTLGHVSAADRFAWIVLWREPAAVFLTWLETAVLPIVAVLVISYRFFPGNLYGQIVCIVGCIAVVSVAIANMEKARELRDDAN